jgi:hypothetical protein
MHTSSQGEAAVWVKTYYRRQNNVFSLVGAHGGTINRRRKRRAIDPRQYRLPLHIPKKPDNRRR